jgi:hypothetical protein
VAGYAIESAHNDASPPAVEGDERRG